MAYEPFFRITMAWAPPHGKRRYQRVKEKFQTRAAAEEMVRLLKKQWPNRTYAIKDPGEFS